MLEAKRSRTMQERTKRILVFKLRMVTKLGSAAFILFFAVMFTGEAESLNGIQFPDILLLVCMPILFSAGLILSFFKELSGGILMMISIVMFNVIAVVQEGYSYWQPDFLLLFAAGAVIAGLGFYSQGR
jgi:hypothetical protein